MDRLKRIVAITLIAGIVGIFTRAQAQEISKITSEQLENLVAQNQGKVVIVDFFATWCPPCRQEIPGFVALQKKFGPSRLVTLGVSVDEGPASVVQNFAQEMGINYAVYQSDGSISRKYRIRAIPTTFLYDTSGKKAKTHIGFVSEEEFDKEISSLLK